MKMSKDYVVVTTISSFVHRYVMHKDDLQKLNPAVDVDPFVWAKDAVTCSECEEVSQKHLGETIISTEMISEKKMINFFDQENDYLKNWTKDQKVKYVRRSLNSSLDF